jgi:DNA-binding transcriptional LysR family regulator
MMLSIGLGWGVLPSSLIDDQLKVLDVSHPPLTRSLGCIYHNQRSLSNAARVFLEQLQAPLPKNVVLHNTNPL